MKTWNLLIIIACLYAPINSFAGVSHCSAEEETVFSCNTGTKIVSLCASHDLSSSSGYLQYRFGHKNKIEFKYPEKKQNPRDYFVRGTLMYSGGGGDYIKFSNGNIQYVVYSAFGKGWEKEGVAVYRDSKLLSNLVCRDAALGKNGWAQVYKANLPKDKETYEIP